jgi:hypothetical protein
MTASTSAIDFRDQITINRVVQLLTESGHVKGICFFFLIEILPIFLGLLCIKVYGTVFICFPASKSKASFGIFFYLFFTRNPTK